MWTLFSFAFVSIAVRFVSRAPYFGVQLGWDDWTALIVLILQLLLDIINVILVHYGIGRDMFMLEEYEIVAVFKVSISPWQF